MNLRDKIRFLTSTGGGVVRGFQGKDIVLVEDESGFEIPTLIKECVVIAPANEEQVRKVTKPSESTQQLAQSHEAEEEYDIIETKEGEQVSIHIAYLANDLKNLSETAYEAYLVNDCNYFLYYNYMIQSLNGWTSKANGVIEPNTKLYLYAFAKEDLNNMERINIQTIAYKKDKVFKLKAPISKELRIDITKFYKLHSFKENEFFHENVILYTIVQQDVEQQEIIVSPKEIEHAMQTKDTPSSPQKRFIKRKEKNTILEIDLHAHEVLETTAGLSNSDILEYQLKVFKEAMHENQKNKGQRIVFIHGKGEGVLKNAIANELKKNYKTATHQDASFQEYGFGATMVTIR